MESDSNGCVVLMERGARWPSTLAVLAEQQGPLVVVRADAEVRDDQIVAVLRDRCTSAVRDGATLGTAVLACGNDPAEAVLLSHPQLVSGLLEQLTQPVGAKLILITDAPREHSVNRLLMLGSSLIGRWLAAGMTVDIRAGSEERSARRPGRGVQPRTARPGSEGSGLAVTDHPSWNTRGLLPVRSTSPHGFSS